MSSGAAHQSDFFGGVLCPFSIGEIQIPFILLWLVGAGVFLTVYFVQFENLRPGAAHGARQVFVGIGSGADHPFSGIDRGAVGAVGLGNIAGVGCDFQRGAGRF